MKKSYTTRLSDTFTAIGIILGFFAIMAAIALLMGI
jgi:phosphatidylserine synthase